jgi:hypothetical protein
VHVIFCIRCWWESRRGPKRPVRCGAAPVRCSTYEQAASNPPIDLGSTESKETVVRDDASMETWNNVCQMETCVC